LVLKKFVRERLDEQTIPRKKLLKEGRRRSVWKRVEVRQEKKEKRTKQAKERSERMPTRRG